jgi:hypothetical protein
MHFSIDTLLRTWCRAGFRIELHHTSMQNKHTWRLGYLLYDDVWATATGADPLIFTGDDLTVATPVDIPHAVSALCAYLSFQDGEISPSYFRQYTPNQLAWRDARAGQLAPWGDDTLHDAGALHPKPSTHPTPTGATS